MRPQGVALAAATRSLRPWRMCGPRATVACAGGCSLRLGVRNSRPDGTWRANLAGEPGGHRACTLSRARSTI